MDLQKECDILRTIVIHRILYTEKDNEKLKEENFKTKKLLLFMKKHTKETCEICKKYFDFIVKVNCDNCYYEDYFFTCNIHKNSIIDFCSMIHICPKFIPIIDFIENFQ